jgi:hypothetical protein
MKRISGRLALHPLVHSSLAWRVEPDSGPDDRDDWITTEQLNRAGITPRSGLRVSFSVRDLHEPPEQQPKRPIRLHADSGLVAPASGKSKKAPR